MNHSREKHILDLMMTALDQEPGAREAYVREVSQGDDALFDTVMARLAHENDAFFETPADTMPCVDPVIGDYTLGAELGSGGMGTVYLATHPFQGRVALKILKPGMDSTDLIRRFHRERKLLGRLAHPNIARLLDGGMTPQGRPFFVMEYIHGEPIHRYCDRRKLDVDARLHLFQEVCSAVETAHRHLIVHRDIKPANILVTDAGVPKLLDFGIARLVDGQEDDETTVTAMGSRFLTLEYASPEQINGMPPATSCDVYSLGVLLYELLTGHRPLRLEQRTLLEAQRVHGETQPVKPSDAVLSTGKRTTGNAQKVLDPESICAARETTPRKLRGKLSGDLDNIILMALRKKAIRRYASVTDLAGDVQRYLEDKPILARGDGMLYRTGKFVSRHRTAVLVMCLLVLLPISFFGALKLEERHTRKEHERAELGKATIEGLSGAMERLMLGFLNVNRHSQEYDVTEGLLETFEELKALPIEDVAAGGMGESVVTMMLDAGTILCNRGRRKDAVQMYDFAAELATAMAHPPFEGAAAFHKAHTLIEMDRLAEAYPLTVKGLRLLPHDDKWQKPRGGAELIMAWYRLAEGDDLQEAVCHGRLSTALGYETHISKARLMINHLIYGQSLQAIGSFREAEYIYSDMAREILGNENTAELYYQEHQISLGEVYWQEGDVANATAVLERVRILLDRNPNDSNFNELATRLAGFCLEMGRFDFAQALLVEVSERAPNSESTAVGILNSKLVEARKALIEKDFSSARALAVQIEGLIKRRNPNAWYRPRYALVTTEIALVSGRLDGLIENMHEMRRIGRRHFPPAHPLFAKIKIMEARIDAAAGRYQAAEAAFEEGLRLYRDGLTPRYPRIADALRHYAAFLDAIGRPHRAEAMRREADAHLLRILGRTQVTP